MAQHRLHRERLLSCLKAELGPMYDAQEAGLAVMLDGIEADDLLDHLPWPAYMLATAWHETGKTMKPIAEWGERAYFNKYDPIAAATPALRARAKKMGNTQAGDGYRYRGRGYVQLTWKANYVKASAKLGVDLVGQPDLALNGVIAWRIMSTGMREGWFTGRKLADYLRPGSEPHYLAARRIINGLDCAALIAGYARTFEACLRRARVTTTT